MRFRLRPRWAWVHHETFEEHIIGRPAATESATYGRPDDMTIMQQVGVLPPTLPWWMRFSGTGLALVQKAGVRGRRCGEVDQHLFSLCADRARACLDQQPNYAPSPPASTRRPADVDILLPVPASPVKVSSISRRPAVDLPIRYRLLADVGD